jgi:hypothetical protein
MTQIDPKDRALILVGKFLQQWAAMELALRDAIGAALRVESVPIQILCANIYFRVKVDILRTLVDVSSLPTQELKLAKRRLRSLGNHAAKRNMIAHDPFIADIASGSVKFLQVKAKGDFKTPEIVWSPHMFREEDRALEGHTKFLECLEQRFKEKPLTNQNYVDALRPFLDMGMGSNFFPFYPSNRRTSSQGLASLLSQQSQEHLDSDPANQETSSQSPENPEK